MCFLWCEEITTGSWKGYSYWLGRIAILSFWKTLIISPVPRATRKASVTGYEAALAELKATLAAKGRPDLEFDRKLACSSAAGGLKMVAIGLVQELTAEAAKRAALGAAAIRSSGVEFPTAAESCGTARAMWC